MKSLLPVVILAGGLATRLRPLTEQIPKALIEINGEPFIAHQLRLLKKRNICQVVMCVGFLGEKICDFVGDGSQFGLQVTYVPDGPQLLGTGGAIKQALSKLENSFFVLYGDSYLDCNYLSVQAAFEKSQQPALMTVFHNKDLWDTSNIEFCDGRIITYDKKHRTERMHYIDYGLSVLTREAFQYAPIGSSFDLAEFYQVLVKQNQLAAFEVNERFYEVGSFGGIKELSEYLEALAFV